LVSQKVTACRNLKVALGNFVESENGSIDVAGAIRNPTLSEE